MARPLGGPRTLRNAVWAALVVLAVVAGVVAGGSLPHTHRTGSPGLFNQEHDLSLLAGLASAGPLPAVVSVVPIALVVVPAVVLAVAHPAGRPRRRHPSRAPPLPA